MAPETSDESIWSAFLREVEWLHEQMNRGLRDRFAPLFALFEIKTIVLSLRNMAIGRTAEIRQLLERSLLADRIKEILLGAAPASGRPPGAAPASGRPPGVAPASGRPPGVAPASGRPPARPEAGRRPALHGVQAAIAALVDVMAESSESFRELEHLHAEGDLQGFENGLMQIFLQSVAETQLDPVMRAFFVFFIDLRNLVLAYKHLRWRMAGPCRFIAGGSVEPARLEEIVKRGDLAELDELATAVTGQTISIAESEGALETILLRSMNQRLLHLRPAMDGVGWIVIHLWRVYVEARNLALLHHGAGVDPAVLERELIV